MKALLFPHHDFSLDKSTSKDKVRTASIAASLIYFEKVYIGSVILPSEIDDSEVENALEKAKKLEGNFSNVSGTGLYSHRNLLEDISVDDWTNFLFSAYYKSWKTFKKDIEVLTLENIVEEVSLSQIASDLNNEEGYKFSEKIPITPGDIEERLSELLNIGGVDLFNNSIREYIDKGSGLTEFYLLNLLKKNRQEKLSQYLRPFIVRSYLLDFYTKSLISNLLNVPIVSDNERHYAMLKSIFDTKSFENNCVDEERLALEVFSHTILAELPIIIPVDFKAIKEIRYNLNDELEEFRSRILSVARDLLYEETITQKDIENSVRKKFSEPLNQLKRKLSDKTHILSRYVTNTALIGGSIYIMSSLLTGAPLPNILPIAMGSALLSSTATSIYNRNNFIKDSNVAFLFKVQENKGNKFI